MKSGYVWIEYVSFEHEIEHRKKEYYKKLMESQRNRPGEDVTEWVYFFLDCLKNIQGQLLQKKKEKEKRESVGVREQHNLVVHGAGRGTRYSIAVTDLVKRDIAIILTNDQRIKEFTLPQASAFIRIKKIVLSVERFDFDVMLVTDQS
jgi:Fic family protein